MHSLTLENSRYIGTHRIIGISSLLHSAHVISRDQDKFVFYVHNYHNQDQLDQLYDPN